MSLKADIYKFLDSSVRICESAGAADELREEFMRMRDRLSAPLRVAVVGIMKAGKSTFLNSIIGEKVVYTGNLETTYTVCWFKYDERPHIKVCFRDGQETEAEYSELEKWSVRSAEKENLRINDVKYLVIYYPAPILKRIEFIDTPGLNSVYGTDAQNTLDFLSLRGSEETLSEASEADAVIYAFSRSAGGFDKEILESFNKGKNDSSSPINSLGILTKTDSSGIWDILGEERPVQAAERVAEKIRENTAIQKTLFTVMPVCAKVSEGFSGLDDGDFAVLEKLAEAETEDLKDLLYDASEFAQSTEEMFECMGDAESRSKLIHAIGQYGILETASAIKNGTPRESIKAVLDEYSGISSVRDILENHFGNRSFLIKVRYVFNRLSLALSKSCGDDKSKAVYRRIREDMEDVASSLYVMDELRVLQMHYNGEIDFDSESEISDLMEITGEYGNTVEARLGVSGILSVAELEKKAEEKVVCWRMKSGDFMKSGAYNQAASVLARSYERIYSLLHELNE